MKKQLSFATLLLILGCSTKVNYPSEWAHLKTQSNPKDCATILGRYSQHGVAVVTQGPFWNFTDGLEPSLLSHILGLDAYPPDAFTHVELNLSDTDPGLSLWVGSELFVSRSFKKDELRCEAGSWRLELDRSLWRSSGISDVVSTVNSLLIQNADDGSLVISKSEKMVGAVIALLLPVYIHEQDWHRFPPATEAELHPEPNAPHGVLSGERMFTRLIPPATQKNRYDNYEQQKSCLHDASAQFNQQRQLTPDEQLRLEGRTTQAFLYQTDKSSDAVPYTEYIDRSMGYIPSTLNARLRKPNWLDPGVADRYVLCLLDAGYVWEDVERND